MSPMAPALNLGKIFANKGSSFVHNPGLLNNQSLIMASLVLVVNRAAIANYTAIKAQGTPEGPYRTHEAYRTTIREFLGFTGGFIVLRQIQGFLKNKTREHFGIKDDPNPNRYELVKNLTQWFKDPSNTEKKIGSFNPQFFYHTKPGIDLEQENVKSLISRVQKACSKVGVEVLQDKHAQKAFMRQVYNMGPIVLASIPTVGLAGVLLEKFTRDHADQVADFISKHLGDNHKPNTVSKPVAQTAPVVPRFSATSVAAPPVLPSFGTQNSLAAASLNSPFAQNPFPRATNPRPASYPTAGFAIGSI